MAIALRNRRTAAAAPDADAPVRDDNTAVADRGATGGVSRTRMARARGASAAGSLLLGIARLIRLITALVVIVIVAGILLRVLGANMTNTIVKDIHDAAKFLVGPFDNMFSISKPKVSIAVNWGLAALVYAIVGGFIASLFARAGARSAARGEVV
jgi:hypothetical protein